MKKTGVLVFLLSLIYTVIISIDFYSKPLNKAKYVPNYLLKYNDLKEEYDLLSENYNFMMAEVLNPSFNKVSNIFLINKGLNDGVVEKSFIVNEKGLVGEVIKCFKNYSVARLIFSNKTKIAIETNDCYGTLNVKNQELYINDLINCQNVLVSDAVFTSKYNHSSSNILIGHISKITNDSLYVKPVINPYMIRYVGIIND